MVDVYYPVVDDISPNAVRKGDSISGNTSSAGAMVVGMLAIPTYWRSFLRNILVERSDGIVVIVENPCNSPFTYQINGPRVVYLGVGDLHESKYDDLSVSSSIVELKNYTIRDTGYSGAPLNADYCPHTIRIYPSEIMQSNFTSKNAVFFLISVVLIFSFTTCIVFLYDWYVERRQLRVKSVAMYSSKIVSSLFPSSVREQIFPKSTANDNNGTLDIGGFSADGSCDATTPIIGKPIAQVYPDTTVIFADIVGFTAWSASRDPTQVFHLLETVYAAFDALARMHGVFKIETIGDCYVAVVGLPKSRKRHAVVMARFANDMRVKMMTVINELEGTLGPVSTCIQCLLPIILELFMVLYILPTLLSL
jgi:Adenylate and Guanylate cyclase catalytic domain